MKAVSVSATKYIVYPPNIDLDKNTFLLSFLFVGGSNSLLILVTAYCVNQLGSYSLAVILAFQEFAHGTKQKHVWPAQQQTNGQRNYHFLYQSCWARFVFGLTFFRWYRVGS